MRPFWASALLMMLYVTVLATATSPPPSPSRWTLYTPLPVERKESRDGSQVGLATMATSVHAKPQKPTEAQRVQSWRDRMRAEYLAANKVPAPLRSGKDHQCIEKYKRHCAGKRQAFERWRAKASDAFKRSKAIPAEQRDEQQRVAFERGVQLRKSHTRAKARYRQRVKERKEAAMAMETLSAQQQSSQTNQ